MTVTINGVTFTVPDSDLSPNARDYRQTLVDNLRKVQPIRAAYLKTGIITPADAEIAFAPYVDAGRWNLRNPGHAIRVVDLIEIAAVV